MAAFSVGEVVVFKGSEYSRFRPKGLNRRFIVARFIDTLGGGEYDLVPLSGNIKGAPLLGVLEYKIKQATLQEASFMGRNAEALRQMYQQLRGTAPQETLFPELDDDDDDIFGFDDPHDFEPGSASGEFDLPSHHGDNDDDDLFELDEDEDEEDLPFHILDEPLEDEEDLPPLLELSTSKYTFWLDPELTLPCVIYSEKLSKQAHLGTNHKEKVAKTLKSLAKRGVTAYCNFQP